MSTLVSQDILRLAQEAANDIDHEDHDEAVRVALDVAAPLLLRDARADDGREGLAKVLGDHYGTSAGGDDYLWAMADILVERGFGKVREARAAELEAAADGWRAHTGSLGLGTTEPFRWLRARAAAIRAGEA